MNALVKEDMQTGSAPSMSARLHFADITDFLAGLHDNDYMIGLLHPAAKVTFALAHWRRDAQNISIPGDNQSSAVSSASLPAAQQEDAVLRQQTVKLSPKVLQKLLVALTLTVLVLIFGCIYQTKVTLKRRESLPKPEDFDFNREFSLEEDDMGMCPSPFTCDLNTCSHSFCCMAVRLGDTHQQLGLTGCLPCFGPFWSVVIMWLLISNWAALAKLGNSNPLPGPLHGGILHMIGDILFASYLASQRSYLRVALGQHGASRTSQWICDTLLYLCCMPCTVCQDAMQVDGAARTAVQCCCIITVKTKDGTLYSGPLIGEPVGVAGGD